MLLHTSNVLQAMHKPAIIEGEYWRWLGIRLVMVIEPRKGGVAKFWEETPRPNTVYLPGRFGERFRMSRQRFQDIERCLCFTAPAPGGEHAVAEVCTHGPLVLWQAVHDAEATRRYIAFCCTLHV